MMPFPNRAIILGILFTLIALCSNSNASAIPHAEYLEKRADPTCARVDVAIVVKVLSRYSSIGNQICTKLLQLSPSETVTTTQSTTVTIPTTTTTSILDIFTEGTSTAVVSSTTTSTSISTSTATVYVTVTATATSTAAATTTTTQVNTAPATTTTVTVITAAPVYKKRQAGSRIGDRYPGCPKELASVALVPASRACSCFVKPTPAATITVESTRTIGTTITLPEDDSTTVPATTTTSTSVGTVVESSSTVTTITITTTVTVTDSITATTTATTTTTTTPVATSTVQVDVTYSQINLPSNDCVYNRYYSYPDVSNDPGPNNNYQQGVRECQALCTGDARCKFFFFLKFDPNKARGFDGAACILDDQPFDPSLLQCRYVNNFNVAYNKNP